MERFLTALSSRGDPRRHTACAGSNPVARKARAAAGTARSRKIADADPAGAKLALLSGARRRRQIQPAADGSAGRARPRVPGGGAHHRVLASSGHARYLADLAARGVAAAAAEDGVVTFRPRGSRVHVATDHPNLRACFAAQMAAFQPDVILASTDDPAQLLLEAALRCAGARVVYLARATLALPFGPDCAFPSEAKTDALRAADAVVGVSQYVADYIRQWSGIPAVHVPISLLDPPPDPELGRFENEFVTLVNPCAVKGISIFLELADAHARNALRGRAHVGHQQRRTARR